MYLCTHTSISNILTILTIGVNKWATTIPIATFFVSFHYFTTTQCTFDGLSNNLATTTLHVRFHTNSTSITDWTLRRPNAQLHLFQRYTTPYWNILAQLGHDEIAVKNQEHRLVAPAVSRNRKKK